MAVCEGRTAETLARKASGPNEWGMVRRLAAALLVAFSMMSALSVVFAGTTSAQTDAVLQWLPEIEAAAAATGVPAEYIAAVIRVESVGDPNAVSSAGAIGLMQVMPYEFQSQGIPESLWFDPATNIMAGSTEIGRFLASTGSIEQALATYFGSGCDSTGTCTDGYISTVLSYAAAYAAAIGSGSTVVDFSGVSITTGSAAPVYDDSTSGGSVDYGATSGNGGWQGAPAPGGEDWQGGPGDPSGHDGEWQGEPVDGTPVPGDVGSTPGESQDDDSEPVG